MAPRLILGSSSKWRRQLWETHFTSAHESEFLSPDIDEKAFRHSDAETLTMIIANAKADALTKRILSDDPNADALLICMDQVVRCDGEIREKPESDTQARTFLASYSAGLPAECVNGIVVHNLKTGARYGANELASVRFMPLPEQTIRDAISKGNIFTSAGAFAIDDPIFEPYVASVNGSREAIIGLPINTLRTLLARASAAPAAPAHRLRLPCEYASGVTIRPIRPADEGAACALFASGMRETIISGLRRELMRIDAPRAAALAGITATAALALPMRYVALVLGVSAIGVAGAIAAVPRKIAHGYVTEALGKDMRSPCAHYLSRRGACFFVAVDDTTGRIAGTVAVEPANDEPNWKWRDGDLELRRMSVAPWARRRGIAHALFAELTRFAEQTPGAQRVVLSTSTLQVDAHDSLYPSLGFGVDGRQQIFGSVSVTYFALPLRPTHGPSLE